MSLNPSNAIAAAINPGRTVFPNLARRTRDRDAWDEVDAKVSDELLAAGINRIDLGDAWRRQTEVPTKYAGELCGWGFKRSWYYWIADGPGVPPDVAETFHVTWGTQVRVDGDCGCPSPLERFKGFAVGCYHIDTVDGLAAFAELLRSVRQGE